MTSTLLTDYPGQLLNHVELLHQHDKARHRPHGIAHFTFGQLIELQAQRDLLRPDPART